MLYKTGFTSLSLQWPAWRYLKGLVPSLLILCSAIQAGLSPDETAIIVNADSWMSRSVANEYALARGIPQNNIIMLDDVGIRDSVTIDEFRDEILGPLLAACKSRGLIQHLSCVAYSTDFPTVVDFKRDVGNRAMPRIAGSQGALTGLTYLYQDVLAQNPDYADMGVNWYARRRRRIPLYNLSWSEDDREEYQKIEGFFQEKQRREKRDEGDTQEFERWLREQWRQALTILTDLAEKYPDHPQLIYNLACAQAQNDLPRKAVATLERAVELGFTDHAHIRSDDDLDPIRSLEDYQALLTKITDWRPEMMPPLPFSGRTGWAPSGTPITPYKGARFLISVMLGVTNGRGNSFAEVTSCLQRAVNADSTAPGGTVFFMQNNDVRSRCRAWAVKSALEATRENDVEAEVLQGVLPENRADVVGLFTGTASFNWEKSGSKILPGAICEHLTSYGGVLRENASQTPLSEFIRQGAAGSSGTICEPFAIQAKFPTAFIQSYYTAGYTLGEAFYLSVSAPYQLLIVGDPLCAPWATPPRVAIEGISPNQTLPSQDITLRLKAEESDLREVTWSIDGRAMGLTSAKAPFTLPLSRFPKGWHEVGVTAKRNDRVATPGRASVPFFVGGEQTEFDLLEVENPSVKWGTPLRLARKGSSEGRLVITWLGAEMASLDPGQQAVELPSEQLAIGTVRLRPILLTGDRAGNIAMPVDVEVKPPQATSSAPAGLVSVLGKGLHVTVAGKTIAYTGQATGDWLKKAGLSKGDALSIDAWFETEQDGLGQFQFQGNLPLSQAVSVDGVRLAVADGKHWRSVPVSLAKGAHHLTIHTIGVENPKLDIRFGIAGTRTVNGDDFRHK